MTEKTCAGADQRLPRASSSRFLLVGAALIALSGILAWHNSFQVPFIFDDPGSITKNESIRSLWPPAVLLAPPKQETVSGRPVLNLSLAINYAISGTDVWSYHLVNLLIHVLAALLLFGIVRRTLLLPQLREKFGGAVPALALVSSLIWLLHPLQTESVTYVVQRAESLMGLFYLLTLYCMIRGSGGGNRGWYAASVASCALGMATKEVMVTAPLMVLAYDRVFLSSSMKEVFRRRGPLYGGLASTWVILALLVASGPRTDSAGLGFDVLTPAGYARTQAGVVLHYLRLALVPVPLVLDYSDWPVAAWGAEFLVPAAILLLLLAGTVTALLRRPPLGFLGLWVFLILLPTSSFLPILEIAAEHRMYLPLAGVVVAAVAGVSLLAGRIGGTVSSSPLLPALSGRIGGYLLAGVVILSLAAGTVHRNGDYRSEFAIWEDTVGKRPGGWRARNNLGLAYKSRGDRGRAFDEFSRAIELHPGYWQAYTNRGSLYVLRGDFEKAFLDYGTALRLKPEDADALYNRAFARFRTGDLDGAIRDCERLLEIAPRDAEGLTILGFARLKKGEAGEAIRVLDVAVSIGGGSARALAVRGIAHLQVGEVERAWRDLEGALAIDPEMALARRGMEALGRRVPMKEKEDR